jgi:hypothetical protein
VVRPVLVIGALLLAVATLIVVGDADGLSRRMPLQVVPRRYARYAAVTGGVLIAVGVIARAFDL